MRRNAVLLGAVALLSCTSDRRPAAPTSSSSSSVAIPTTAPTTTASAVPTTSSPLSAITGCPDPGPLRAPDPLRPHYTASATVDVASSTVAGSVTVTFTPDLDTREIVFRLWPNAPLQTERECPVLVIHKPFHVSQVAEALRIATGSRTPAALSGA